MNILGAIESVGMPSCLVAYILWFSSPVFPLFLKMSMVTSDALTGVIMLDSVEKYAVITVCMCASVYEQHNSWTDFNDMFSVDPRLCVVH